MAPLCSQLEPYMQLHRQSSNQFKIFIQCKYEHDYDMIKLVLAYEKFICNSSHIITYCNLLVGHYGPAVQASKILSQSRN